VGTAARTNVYISSNITGGQKDAVSYVGSNVQLIILELSPTIAVDQKICGTGTLPGGGTAASGNITTAHTAELALGLGTAAPISSGAFHSPGSGWAVAFGGLAGSQIVEYQNLPTINTIAATAPISGGTNETYAMAEVTFYTGSASSGGGSGGTSTSISTSNSRVQGTACETGGFGGGAGSATCFLSGVKAGNTLVWFADANTNQGLSISDNCGGTYITLDSSTANNSSVFQGYSTGSHGNCTVTFSSSATYSITGMVEEISSGHIIDRHSLSAPGLVQSSITTIVVATTAADYCFTGYVDQAGQGTAIPSAGPFVVRDGNVIFPIADADYKQSSPGTITAAWTGGQPASKPAVGMMCF
jgi:hypothetical protein